MESRFHVDLSLLDFRGVARSKVRAFIISSSSGVLVCMHGGLHEQMTMNCEEDDDK